MLACRRAESLRFGSSLSERTSETKFALAVPQVLLAFGHAVVIGVVAKAPTLRVTAIFNIPCARHEGLSIFATPILSQVCREMGRGFWQIWPQFPQLDLHNFQREFPLSVFLLQHQKTLSSVQVSAGSSMLAQFWQLGSSHWKRNFTE